MLIFFQSSARQASVAYLFCRRGSITFQPREGLDVDDVLDAAIEVGAEDVDLADGGGVQVIWPWTHARDCISYLVQVLTAHDTMQSVAESLQKHPSVASIQEMSLIWRPVQPVERGPQQEELEEQVKELVSALEDTNDIVAVYTTRG
jgi:transcriptional/translational regulatory protein YebC/TACO1